MNKLRVVGEQNVFQKVYKSVEQPKPINRKFERITPLDKRNVSESTGVHREKFVR